MEGRPMPCASTAAQGTPPAVRHSMAPWTQARPSEWFRLLLTRPSSRPTTAEQPHFPLPRPGDQRGLWQLHKIGEGMKHSAEGRSERGCMPDQCTPNFARWISDFWAGGCAPAAVHQKGCYNRETESPERGRRKCSRHRALRKVVPTAPAAQCRSSEKGGARDGGAAAAVQAHRACSAPRPSVRRSPHCTRGFSAQCSGLLLLPQTDCCKLLLLLLGLHCCWCGRHGAIGLLLLRRCRLRRKVGLPDADGPVLGAGRVGGAAGRKPHAVHGAVVAYGTAGTRWAR